MVHIIDPSDKFRPEKKEELFRDYTNKGNYFNRVKNTYYQMHTKQSYEFAKAKVYISDLHCYENELSHLYVILFLSLKCNGC